MLTSLVEGILQLRYQDPKIEKHGENYRIRPYVPVLTKDGTLDRVRRSVILGRIDQLSQDQAKRRKQQVMATINAGRIVVQSQIPFAEIVEKFKECRIPLLERSTAIKYLQEIRGHILPTFGSKMICEIDRAAVEAWHAQKLADGLAYTTRAGLVATLGMLFNAAKDWGLWDGETPTERLKLGRKTYKRERRALTPEQFRAFLFALRDSRFLSAASARAFVLVGAYTGLRVSEILGLRWSDIDLKAGTVSVNGVWFHKSFRPRAKNDSSVRTVGMGRVAVAALQQILPADADPSTQVFRRVDNGDVPLYIKVHTEVIRPALKAIAMDFEGAGMHTFRRSAITWRQQAGATPIEAMLMAGHTSMDMTMHYTMVDQAREQQVIGKMVEMIGGETIQ